MAAVTKGSGRYFSEFERVWTETRDTGVQPFWVGRLPTRLGLAVQPNPDVIRSLCDGRAFLPRVQANRVGCYDLTFSFGKSISLLANGLTPPSQWKAWAEVLVGVTKPLVEKCVDDQRINAGRQGKDKIPSFGAAVGFVHREGFRGQPAAHVHYAVPNVSTDGGRNVGSIANARDLYSAQGHLRAKSNKLLDDHLQAQGYETVRSGSKVELAKVPRALIDELSPARQAMNEAKEQKGFSGAKAHDFYARDARREAGPRVHTTPEEMHRESTELARKHGVTLDSLKRDPSAPPPPRTPASEMSAAYHTAREALSDCTKKFGRFTEDQYLERLYSLGIGRPTTTAALEGMGQALLKDKSLEGVTRHKEKDGTILYSTKGSAAVQQKAVRHAAGTQAAAGQAPRSEMETAWGEFKTAVKGLGGAVLIATARKASEVAERLTEIINPAPKRITVDASKLGDVIEMLRPTHYLLAHAKALVAGLKASGNPHERAGVAEKAFAELRRHKVIPRNAVLVVERGGLATPRELRLIAKIAKRDGASVVLCERDPVRLQQMAQNKAAKHHGRNQSP